MKRHLVVFPLLVAMVLPHFARGASITIAPSRDNTIFAESDTLSDGAGTRIFAGKTATNFTRRALVQFDLTGLVGAGATIDSVVVRMTVVITPVAAVTVALHRLLADWGEGTTLAPGGEGAGGKATPGSATWLQRFYLAPAALWTNPGGDFDPVASASRPVNGVGTYTWRSPGLTADVVFWLANPSQNFGWEVTGNEAASATAKGFGSRQNATPANRPALTIYFTPPTAAGPVPAATRLLPVLPNPFNPSATIRYELAASQRVNLTVFDTAGRKVATLVDATVAAGTHEVTWHGEDARGARVASGVYLVKMVTAHSAPQTEKMVLLK